MKILVLEFLLKLGMSLMVRIRNLVFLLLLNKVLGLVQVPLLMMVRMLFLMSMMLVILVFIFGFLAMWLWMSLFRIHFSSFHLFEFPHQFRQHIIAVNGNKISTTSQAVVQCLRFLSFFV